MLRSNSKQSGKSCAFMFVFMSFLYFRLYFRCILAFFVFVCAAVYGVIKKE